MILWLWRLIVGTYRCRHRWKTVNDDPLKIIRKSTTGTEVLRGRVYQMQCEHCGEITSRTVTPYQGDE